MSFFQRAFQIAQVKPDDTVYVAVDVSGGVRFDKTLEVFRVLADACTEAQVKRAVVVTFDSRILDTFDVRGNFGALKRVKTLRCGGGTMIEPVMEFVRYVDGAEGDRKLFIVSDGMFDASVMAKYREIKATFMIDRFYDRSPSFIEQNLTEYGEFLLYDL